MINLIELKKKVYLNFFSGRNDIGFFNIEIPENCIGVLMTVCILFSLLLIF
jgi:hypothetical protein